MPQRNVHDLQDDDERLSTSQQIHAEALRASDFLGFGEDASDYETDRGEGGYDGDHDRDGRIYPVSARRWTSGSCSWTRGTAATGLCGQRRSRTSHTKKP